MNDWNGLLKESIGTPEVPGGRGRKKNKIVRTPPSIEQAMAGVHTTYNSQRKAGAPDRVMTKAFEYHAVETGRRQAKYIKPDRSNIKDLLYFLLFVCTIFLCVWLVLAFAGVT